MTTDWVAIWEKREDANLSALDESGPQRILEMLARLGLSGVEKEGLVLLDVKAAPVSHRAKCVALVSASELFAWDAQQDARLLRRRASRIPGATDLFAVKVALWKQKHEDLWGPHAYLYIVDLDNWLDEQISQDITRHLCTDVRGVRKHVCRPNELVAVLTNPFESRRTPGKLPRYDVQRMDLHPYEPPPRDFVSTVTHPFARVQYTDVWLEKLNAHADVARVTALANTLVHRVMGTDMQLVAGSDEVLIERYGKRSSMPWFCLGNGEQYALAMCIWLALAYEEASEEMWLGLTEVVDALDLSRYILLLDVLRDFVVATGANVYLKTNKSDYMNVAQEKFKQAIHSLAATFASA